MDAAGLIEHLGKCASSDRRGAEELARIAAAAGRGDMDLRAVKKLLGTLAKILEVNARAMDEVVAELRGGAS